MADQTPPPPEAIAAQKAFDAAHAEVQRLSGLMPFSVAMVAGEASIPKSYGQIWRRRGRHAWTRWRLS